MKLFPIVIPPGVYRRGTIYQSRGRVYTANLIRWYGKAIGIIGGWVERAQDAVTGKARAIITWRDNEFSRWGAIGTHSNLYAFNSVPDIIDITPGDLVAGRADETAKTGFGYGVFGAGTFGTPRPDTGASLPASVWDLDTWGENLVACLAADGRLLEWAGDVSMDAQVIANAPTDCSGCFVTPERAMVGLGANGNPRRVKWSDLEDNTNWTESATSRAGEYDLQTSGVIQRGVRLPGQSLILTDLDAWTMQYLGGVVAYGFVKVGSDCGALSKGAVCTAGDMAVWWGQGGFYVFDGAFRPISCDVWEFLQQEISTSQKSKITSFHNSEFNEVWWFYPSGGINPDSYVVWKYPTANDPVSTWNIGGESNLRRLCAVGPGVFENPIAVDDDGVSYDHETGASFINSQGNQTTPFFTTGPMQIADGDNLARVVGMITDQEDGDGAVTPVSVGFTTRLYPMGSSSSVAPIEISSTGKTDFRFTCRQAELIVEFPRDASSRFGEQRLMIEAGGRR